MTKIGSGTHDDSWALVTAPGSSAYTMFRDDTVEPAVLVCQVGSTRLTYQARCIEDLHAMLVAHGDWMDLGATDERQGRPPGPSRHGGAPQTTRSAAGTGCARATAGASACTCRHCWRRSARPS